MANISKRDVLNALKTLVFEDVTVGDVTVTPDDFYDFIDSSIVTLDKRAEATAKRQAEKRAAGDELRAKIKEAVTGESKTIPQILETLGDPEVTSAMVVSRLGQLVKLGEVEKEDTNVDGRKIKTYIAL